MCDFREIIPTAHECSIHWNDLSPSLADGSSSGLPWHCWLLWPRPPTTTHPVSSNRPASTHCSRAFCSPIGWSSSHARSWLVECCHPPLRVVSFVILFFFPFPLLLFTPHVLHTQLREKGASQRKDDLNPIGTGSSSGNRRLFVLNWLQKQKRDIKIFYSSVPSRKFNEMDSLEVRQFY